MAMKLIAPESLTAARVYFTQFDRVTYSQVAWTPADVERIKRSLARKVKLLALVKGHVVIAASHLLESELAHEVLFDHPRLLSEGVVVPALRSEFGSVGAFLDAKIAEGKEGEVYAGPARRDMARLLDGEAALAVRWDVASTSGWFKRRLLADLREDGTLLRTWLARERILVPANFLASLEGLENPSRKDVYKLAQATGNKRLWTVACEWADFLYYLSGALAVRSEGVLPQENLLDFSLSDLAGGRTQLTDLEVFFKIYVDLVKTATGLYFPVDLLDALTTEDALDLHRIAIDDDFTAKYEAIQTRTKAGLMLQDAERLVLALREVETYERELRANYARTIDRELPLYLRARKRKLGTRILQAIGSLFVPYFDAPQNAQELVVSGLKFAGKDAAAKAFESRTARGVRALQRLARRGDADARPVLLAFADEVRRRYASTLGIER
jgi:hypothetical protein